MSNLSLTVFAHPKTQDLYMSRQNPNTIVLNIKGDGVSSFCVFLDQESSLHLAHILHCAVGEARAEEAKDSLLVQKVCENDDEVPF